MATTLPNPTALSVTTRLPPQHARALSRSKSPERSPTRKAQFAARELDPLLQNLSPDSTLEALQKTNTIAGNQAEQNALAKSISDATESERKLGIRAAIAAKNLREWTQEVSAWFWPSREDRSWGAGFIPPSTQRSDGASYCGSLPSATVKQYEDRLDEIWDAIETLGTDELKDYVFSFHNPRASPTETNRTYPSSYGRMRDFTALITATVIQSLPVQANLLIMLDTWSIRLSVLKEVPNLLLRFDRVKLALSEINAIVQDPKVSRRLTKGELETAKVMFGNKVSQLCKRVDDLLDQLEGQEDSLPQAWLDSLDDIENKYAEWVAQAEQVVLKNRMSSLKSGAPTINTDPGTPVNGDLIPIPELEGRAVNDTSGGTAPVPTPPSPQKATSPVKRKPLLEVNPSNTDSKHRRGLSDVSMAESTFSGYSENAEIMDATETKVMPSPRISVVDNQSSPEKNVTSWMGIPNSKSLTPPRPTVLLQRASTASIEVVPKEHVKEVTLRRSASHDLLTGTRKSPKTTLQSMLPHADAFPLALMSQQKTQQNTHLQEIPDALTPLATSPSPSLRVDPLSVRGKSLEMATPVERPTVPRRSSKRLSMPLLGSTAILPTAVKDTSAVELAASVKDTQAPSISIPTELKRQETFDDRLKSILASMPTKIRLADGSDSGLSSGTVSPSSTRASSPIQELRLSPVKDGRSGRPQNVSGIRVYNLSKAGKSRDAVPIKLFVRAVGEHGERVMVRVGGGWADLAEYLREYSLHHGGRSLLERKVEITSYPGGNASKILSSPLLAPASHRGNSSVVSLSEYSKLESNFDFGLSGQDPTQKTASNRSSSSLDSSDQQSTILKRPPPVPLIPNAHSASPKLPANMPRGQNASRSSTPANNSRPTSRVSVHTTTTPMITSTTSPSNPYTPLGAAGPVHSSRRATSHTYSLMPHNGTLTSRVNQARAASASHSHSPHLTGAPTPASNRHSTTVISPITTTTTTITSARIRGPNAGNTSTKVTETISPITPTPNPTSRPPSSMSALSPEPLVRPQPYSSPAGSDLTQQSSSSGGSNTLGKGTPNKLKKSDSEGRRRSMMNFGDVGGIRRVFLRKKSDKS